MIKSMTGFGRYEAVKDNIKITVEIKTVNHRYLDLTVKVPKKLSSFETVIRSILKSYMQRGKADVFVTYEDSGELNCALQYNEALAGEYLRYFRQMAETFQLQDDIRVSTLAQCPDVFTMTEQNTDESELETVLTEAVHGAARQCVDFRVKEGENLKNDLLGKLDAMSADLDFIEARSPQIITEYRKKLEIKVRELLVDKQLDDSRIAAEVMIYADKVCIDEEIVRLRSHIQAVRKELPAGTSIGRKLDFIAQEMNREANTILAKANDLIVSDISIELKTCIEKIREQIQNIE